MTRHRHDQVLFYLSAAIFLLHISPTATADEGAVMSSFLSGLSSPPSGWSKATPYCYWTRITCDTSKRVTSIELDSMSVSGTLPSDFSSLSQLRTLSLRRNSFSGALPLLAGLASLQEAHYDANGFESVESGFLMGLTSSTDLSFTDNGYLAPWSLPSYLADSAANANLSGSLPEFLGSFPNLQSLRLSYNNFTGSLLVRWVDLGSGTCGSTIRLLGYQERLMCSRR